jgi:hypothetical protein
MKSNLGGFKSKVSPYARYLFKDPEGRWSLKPFDAYKHLSKRATPSVGVVEVFAEEALITPSIGRLLSNQLDAATAKGS